MADLDIFTYSGQQVRTVVIDGEPWFVAADVASHLGYSATSAMTRSLDDDERGVRTLHTPSGDQDMTVITEAGLYAAIIRSTIPAAKAFKRWITHEVIPALRRTGTYTVQPSETPEQFFARALTMANLVLEQKDAVIAELEPKAEAYDRIAGSDTLIKVEVAARKAGIGRNTAFALLRRNHIFSTYANTPLAPYAHRFEEVPTTYQNSSGQAVTTFTTKVRADSFDWLVERLKSMGGAR